MRTGSTGPHSIAGLTAHVAVPLWLLLAIMAPTQAAAASAADLVPAIRAALAERGAPADARIMLADPRQTTPFDASHAPAFDAVSYNPRSGRFLVRMRSQAGGADIVVAGTARAPVMSAALIGPVARGEEISDDNVALVETIELAPDEAALGVADIAGTLARRALPAGAVLRRSDVETPVVVRKGALVVVSFERPGLRLSQQGTAGGAGARGDAILVEIAGGRSLRAVVTGPGTAAIVSSRLAALEVR
jgi:flagella basal body P-ring formation protein FlgA